MTPHIPEEKTPPAIYFIITILPFLLFYWMVPFIAGKSIGSDYQIMAIENQMELLFSIKTGSFPLFVPGFASDHSSSALTLGEVYHPLSHMASILPGYWDGKALQWNTFMRLFFLGLTHLALFAFLRKLKLNILFSFLLSCITVYNLRMLDLFRYGASLENYTGFILLCTAIGWNFVDPAKYRGPICIIAATYLLVCGGHPQMMYYGFLGAGLFLLIIPFFISTMLPEIHVDFKIAFRFWIQAVICLVLGILLSSAYILPFYFDFIATNTERVGQGYQWADSIKDTFAGTLNNFFLPLRSEVHGAFGGSSLIIMAVLLPMLKFFKIKIPRPVWFIWGMAVFVFLYMQGARTPVHRWVWEYLPLASSFRYAGRISLIMPVLIMLLLSWVIKAEPFSIRINNKSVMMTPLKALALTSLLAMTLYFSLIAVSFLFRPSIMLEFAPFTPVAIRKISRSIEIIVILSGIASLLSLAFYNMLPRADRAVGIILCFAVLVQIGTVLQYGTWVTDRRDTPTFRQMQAEKREKLEYRYYPGTGMYSSIVTTQLNESFKEPFSGKIYYDVVPVSSQDDAYARMRNERTPQKIFIEGYKQKNAFSDAAHSSDIADGEVKLVYSSFNRIQFRIFSPIPAFFGFSYPYTGHWDARLNDHEVQTYRANGASHAVRIPQGESLIEFRYFSSPAFWGMIISCTVFVIIGLYGSFQAATILTKTLSAILVLTLGIGGFMLWRHSLYSGGNLGTKYTWTYNPPLPIPNLAYGKKTWISLPLRGSPAYLHSSRAVDGNRSPESGFATYPQDNPAWTVDLHRMEKIKTIVLYESFHDQSVNIRPLNIALSEDGRQWRTAASVKSMVNQLYPVRISFETPQTARYIQVQASGHSSLRLDEVEVYGPGEAKL